VVQRAFIVRLLSGLSLRNNTLQLSTIEDSGNLVVETRGFLAALDASAFDRCLEYLRRTDTRSGADDALLNCRLAEALMRAERRAEALECCRRAFPGTQAAEPLLRICAWVFSNCACHEEAAAAYCRLIELCPGWVEGHRHASGSLAAAGRFDEAILHATAASDFAPANGEFALHAASLLLAAGRFGEAAETALRAAADPAKVTDAAELLIRCGRIDAAAELLAAAAPMALQPRLLRVLSAAEMLRDRWDASLAAIDQALAAAPDNPEYHVHRGHLLWRLGDVAEATAAFDRAAEMDPAGVEVKRAQMSLYLATGLVSEATAAGGELLHRYPDDKPTAEAVLHLLNHRLDTIDGEYVVLGERERRVAPPRRAPGLFDRLGEQRRVIRALILREMRTRFADHRLGYGWALIEPVLHIVLLSATFAVLMQGRPPIGTHFFIFYYTGLIPYHVFVHTSSGMSHAIIANAPLLQLPPITSFDVIAARGILEIVTDVVVAAILLAGFAAIGVAAMPDDLWAASIALLAIAALGGGLGFINAVVTVFCRSWEKTYAQLTRVLYFISGIFYVPAMMPDWARDMLAWNPLLQAIDWFRSGFFGSYQPHWLDRSYLVILAILALLAGFGLQRGLRRRLSTPL
jgi:ABC-type polysaccharide/polyol phosphate export permease/tetratricopeptide (TPR) repeat protein